MKAITLRNRCSACAAEGATAAAACRQGPGVAAPVGSKGGGPK